MESLPPGHSCEPGSKGNPKQVVDQYGAVAGTLYTAPATQTTVVTTTTTTTTAFAPIVMPAPKNLQKRDSKEYPLAHQPPPESIRRFFFAVGGSQACFEEASDVVDTLHEVRLMRAGNSLLLIILPSPGGHPYT